MVQHWMSNVALLIIKYLKLEFEFNRSCMLRETPYVRDLYNCVIF